MIKRVVIAGCRHYSNYDEAKIYIDSCLREIQMEYEVIIISGGATGADSIGERYAIENNLGLERYHAERNIYGKKAGPMRNRKMAEVCDLVICFWDGKSKGTRSMIDNAQKLGKRVFIKII